jgi:hypothetical protein
MEMRTSYFRTPTKLNIHFTGHKTGPVRLAQQRKQCVYNIPCDCGIRYIGETSRPLEVCLKEHKYNLTQRLLQISKLARHAHEEGHKICRKETKVFQIEPDTTYRKYKESANMSLVDHLISQTSLDISSKCVLCCMLYCVFKWPDGNELNITACVCWYGQKTK